MLPPTVLPGLPMAFGLSARSHWLAGLALVGAATAQTTSLHLASLQVAVQEEDREESPAAVLAGLDTRASGGVGDVVG